MFVFCLVLGIFLVDQAVKFWAVSTLSTGIVIPVIKDVFELRYIENRGASFGIFENQRLFFIIVTIISIALIIYIIKKNILRHPVSKLGIYFALGGALGNFADRLFHGFVVDLFYLKIINFAVFNVADSFLVCGGILLAFSILFLEPKLQKKEESYEKNSPSDE